MKGSITANEFWEKHMAGRWQGKVQLHCIIPTTMMTVPRVYDPKEFLNRTSIEHESTRLHHQCCICEIDLQKKNACVVIRCLVSKFDAECSTFENGVMSKAVPGFWYRAAYMNANVCEQCFPSVCKQFKTMVYLPSDHTMIHHFLDVIEAISAEVQEAFTFIDVPLHQFLEKVFSDQSILKREVLKQSGKTDKCRHCDKPGAKKRCGGCKFETYCNAQCSTKDWPLHRQFCKWVKKGKIALIADAKNV